jgi:hypothetical protein
VLVLMIGPALHLDAAATEMGALILLAIRAVPEGTP